MTVATLEQELESRGPTDLPAASDPLLGRRSTIFWLVLAAFAVRLAFLFVLQTYRPGRVDDFAIASETTNRPSRGDMASVRPSTEIRRARRLGSRQVMLILSRSSSEFLG
jgi:hypothetical protein